LCAAFLKVTGTAVQAARPGQLARRAQPSAVSHSGELMVCELVCRPNP
jgi:hypothetical protein